MHNTHLNFFVLQQQNMLEFDLNLILRLLNYYNAKIAAFKKKKKALEV